MQPYGSTRIWLITVKKLRLIAALTEKSIVAVLDEMASEKLAEVKREHREDLK